MSTWNQNILTHWFVAARSDLVVAKPLAITVLDRPIVLVRFESGSISAFEDRCPHRQVPLSQGRITPNGLECPYHGWTFGSDGRCTRIPGIPPEECKPNVGARTIQVKDIDGLVWVRFATSGMEAPPSLVADHLRKTRRFVWQTMWHAHIIDALENFLDPLHTHLVHAGLVRRGAVRRRTEATVSVTTEGFCVDYQGLADQTGILYRMFESPRLSERAHFAGAGTAQIEYRYKNGSVVRITLHFTPESANRTHVFTTLHVENRFAPAWAVRFFVWPFLKKVATQDAHILKLQSENIARFAGACNASTKLDFVRPYLETIWQQEQAVASVLETNRIKLHL
jgi:phenylpropionate dioxygenase-like ring-hydroxylating dioxygenase large terminal subunit